MAETYLIVGVNLGLLVAIAFVIYEVFLLPLFEHTRESLTIAAARRRIATGFPVALGPDGQLPRAFGLSDGVARPNSFAALPRLLKVLVKIALIVSLCIWESQLQSVKRATAVSIQFGNSGGFSSVMSPLPAEGLREGTVRALVPYGREEADAERNYSVSSTAGIDLVYPSQCISTDGNEKGRTRTAFFGVYSVDVAGRPSLVCLNGTDGRERAPIFTYNPDSRHTTHANVTSVVLGKLVAHDVPSALFAADVLIDKGPLAGTYPGFLCVTFQTHISKDVSWSMYGLLLHRARGTVLRVNFALTKNWKLCGAVGALGGGAVEFNGSKPVWPGLWKRKAGNTTCPTGQRLEYRSEAQGPLQHISDVQDVGLRFAKSEMFKIGPLLDILRAWLSETPWYMFRPNKLFTMDIREMIEGDVFFFSTAKAPSLALNVGHTRKHVQMATWSSALLFAVIATVLLYCVTSYLIEVTSRRTTGITSDCITREAVMSFLRDEGVMRGHLTRNARSRLAIGLTNVGLDRQRIGLVSEEYCTVRDKRRMISNGYLDVVEPG